jgi:hypothetical protein
MLAVIGLQKLYMILVLNGVGERRRTLYLYITGLRRSLISLIFESNFILLIATFYHRNLDLLFDILREN